MGDQVNMTIAHEVIYKSDEIGGTIPCPYIHWATDDIMYYLQKNRSRVAFPKGFLVDFLAKQCSQVGKLILVIWPSKLSLISLFILSCPIWPSLACHTT